MPYRFLIPLSVVLAGLKQELSGDGMESNGDYKVSMRDHNTQSNRKDKNILQDMRRYSGVLSVYGDQQVVKLTMLLKLYSYRDLLVCEIAAVVVYKLLFFFIQWFTMNAELSARGECGK